MKNTTDSSRNAASRQRFEEMMSSSSPKASGASASQASNKVVPLMSDQQAASEARKPRVLSVEQRTEYWCQVDVSFRQGLHKIGVKCSDVSLCSGREVLECRWKVSGADVNEAARAWNVNESYPPLLREVMRAFEQWPGVKWITFYF